MSVLVRTTVVAAALTLMAACGSTEPRSALTAPEASRARSVDGAFDRALGLDLTRAGRAIKVEGDDAGLRDSRPAFSMPRVRTAVVGTVQDFGPGPGLGRFEDDPHPQPTTVLTVNVLSAIKGKATPGSQVYVQLDGGWERGPTLTALPRGTVVVVYGVPVPDEPHTQNPSWGKPAEATFVRVGSIGLAALAPQGGVVFPVRGDVHPTWGIDDLIPAQALTEDLRSALGRR